jgi:hypothetical protein
MLGLLGLAAAPAAVAQPPVPPAADFMAEPASTDARRIARWAAAGDAGGLPFVILDKVEARVFVFGADARLRGAAPALIGIARGDDTVLGIGARRLAAIGRDERTTPAGRFVAALGNDFVQDVLWIDYHIALSMHRVVTGGRRDRRHERLASPTPLDNRISYGCINVPAEFYDNVVAPAFRGTVGIVYILPDTRPTAEVFPGA